MKVKTIYYILNILYILKGMRGSYKNVKEMLKKRDEKGR